MKRRSQVRASSSTAPYKGGVLSPLVAQFGRRHQHRPTHQETKKHSSKFQYLHETYTRNTSKKTRECAGRWPQLSLSNSGIVTTHVNTASLVSFQLPIVVFIRGLTALFEISFICLYFNYKSVLKRYRLTRKILCA